MVGFTKHLYRFTGAKAGIWFSLLLKYHEGIEVRVDANDLSFTGELNQALINKIPNDCENLQSQDSTLLGGLVDVESHAHLRSAHRRRTASHCRV